MRIDPAEVFAVTLTSLPLRLLLAWGVGAMGAFLSTFMGSGFEAFDLIGWQVLFFPFFLFSVAMTSGWWGFVAVPLFVVVSWQVLIFLRGEGVGTTLCWIFLLPFLINICTSGFLWPFAAVGVGVAILLVLRQQRVRYGLAG